jgi:hypothetical protein
MEVGNGMPEYLLLLKLDKKRLLETIDTLRKLPKKPNSGVDLEHTMNIFGTWHVAVWFNSDNSSHPSSYLPPYWIHQRKPCRKQRRKLRNSPLQVKVCAQGFEDKKMLYAHRELLRLTELVACASILLLIINHLFNLSSFIHNSFSNVLDYGHCI